MIHAHTVHCPYCGEAFETTIDAGGGCEEYIEDCAVCCRPIVFRVEADAEGQVLSVETHREDD